MIFRGLTVFLLLYRMYRRLPRSEQKRLMRYARRYAPVVATRVARQAQARARTRGR